MSERPRILIVEDEEGLAIHLKFMLNKAHYEPLEVVSYGEQAIQKAGELKPDLILMDINLAGQMDGIEAACQIRDRFDIPIIYCSAVAEDETLRQAAGSSPYAYLVKPVKEVELRMAIAVALEKHQAETLLRQSEQRQGKLIEMMSSGFVLFEVVEDGQGRAYDYRFLMANPAYERILNVNVEQLIGRTLRETSSGGTKTLAHYLNPLFARAAQNGAALHLEHMVPEVGRHLSINVYQPVPGQFAVMLDDITERKSAEENQRESSRRIKQNLDRMEALRQIDQAIITHTDLPSMVQTILDKVTGLVGIDVAALFVPSEPSRTRGATGTLMRRTGSLSALRLAGMAGLPDETFSGVLLDWLFINVNEVYRTAKPNYLYDLHEEDHAGAELLTQMGFSGSVALPLLTHGQIKGVLQFLRRRGAVIDGDWSEFLHSLSMQMAIAIDSVEMLENLRRLLSELGHAYEETIKGWAKALELRDYETSGHSDRVSSLTAQLALTMGLREPDVTHCRYGALLHDVGKMAIPDSILKKTGKLSDEDWVTMKQHPTKAYELLKEIDFLRPALDVVYCHHERWDGNGYPRGLKGEEIPLSARIFAVVDVWDALSNNRPYRLAWPRDEVIKYIAEHSGKQFDPRVVEVFLRMI